MLSAACADESASVPDATDSGDTAADDDTADTRPGTPTPWIFEDDARPSPTLGKAELEGAVAAAVRASLELDSVAVRDLHDLLFPPPAPGTGDPNGCPFVLTYDYGTAKAFYWQGECTAADGTRFSGRGYATWYDDQPIELGTVDGFDYYLAGRIEADDGTWLEGAGNATAYDGGGGDIVGFGRALDGTFEAGGPRAPASPWLDGTRRPAMTVTGWRYLPTGGKNLVLSGGIGGLTDFPGGVSAVALDALMVRTLTAGAACEREFGGAASVRGPDGNWYDVVFDGPSEEAPAATPASACDGCGDTFFRGDLLAPTCVPTAPFIGWELQPW